MSYGLQAKNEKFLDQVCHILHFHSKSIEAKNLQIDFKASERLNRMLAKDRSLTKLCFKLIHLTLGLII